MFKYTSKTLSAILSAIICASGASAPLITERQESVAAPAYAEITEVVRPMIDAEAPAQTTANAKSDAPVVSDAVAKVEVQEAEIEIAPTEAAECESQTCERSYVKTIEVEAPVAIMTTEATGIDAIAPETTTTEADPEPTIGSTVSTWYVKPGDQKMFKSIMLTFNHFQKVSQSEYWDGNTWWTELSGYMPGTGEWTYRFNLAKDSGDYNELPFTVDHDCYAIGLPIAADIGPTTVEGWTFNAADNESVSYCPAAGVTYVYGDGWNALVMDSTRYSEWKYSSTNGDPYPDNFENKEAYNLKACTEDSWVIATAGAPEIFQYSPKTYEKPQELTLDEVCERIAAANPITGFSDPKWGSIHWDSVGHEDWSGDVGATHYLSGTISDQYFEIAIDSVDNILGFCTEFEWQAAIVPSDYIKYQDVSFLCWGDYTINFDGGNQAYIYQNSTGEGRYVKIDGPANMDGAVMLITITDGKHATAISCRPELVAFVYALGR